MNIELAKIPDLIRERIGPCFVRFQTKKNGDGEWIVGTVTEIEGGKELTCQLTLDRARAVAAILADLGQHGGTPMVNIQIVRSSAATKNVHDGVIATLNRRPGIEGGKDAEIDVAIPFDSSDAIHQNVRPQNTRGSPSP